MDMAPPPEFESAPVIATERVAACAVCGRVETREYARGLLRGDIYGPGRRRSGIG